MPLLSAAMAGSSIDFVVFHLLSSASLSSQSLAEAERGLAGGLSLLGSDLVSGERRANPGGGDTEVLCFLFSDRGLGLGDLRLSPSRPPAPKRQEACLADPAPK